MANFTVADVKALRDKTGAGMMDVKKALDEADGDIAAAEEILRVNGMKSISKREGRTAANGLVVSAVRDSEAGQRGILIEINAETDFVAKNDKFIAMADEILEAAVAAGACVERFHWMDADRQLASFAPPPAGPAGAAGR